MVYGSPVALKGRVLVMADMIDCRVNGRVPTHLTSEDTYAEVTSAYGVREIRDSAAVAIASWWQSPGTQGRAMAELSTTGQVEVSALLADISAAYPCTHDRSRDWFALGALATWAINHPTRCKSA